jgi:hypothetical protein
MEMEAENGPDSRRQLAPALGRAVVYRDSRVIGGDMTGDRGQGMIELAHRIKEFGR